MATMSIGLSKGSARAPRTSVGAVADVPSVALGTATRPNSSGIRRAVKLAARARGFQAGSANAQAAIREAGVHRARDSTRRTRRAIVADATATKAEGDRNCAHVTYMRGGHGS
eukprot:5627423-Pyramimonas_sp.AAC.1